MDARPRGKSQKVPVEPDDRPCQAQEPVGLAGRSSRSRPGPRACPEPGQPRPESASSARTPQQEVSSTHPGSTSTNQAAERPVRHGSMAISRRDELVHWAAPGALFGRALITQCEAFLIKAPTRGLMSMLVVQAGMTDGCLCRAHPVAPGCSPWRSGRSPCPSL